MLTHMHKAIHKVVDTFSEETEAKKVTGSDRTLASGAPARPVSSGRGTREGLQRADAGHGTSARPVHFCVAAGARDRTQCVSIRCK
jgi:hypothetical protein